MEAQIMMTKLVGPVLVYGLLFKATISFVVFALFFFFSFYSIDLNIQKYKNSFDPNLVTEFRVLESFFFFFCWSD